MCLKEKGTIADVANSKCHQRLDEIRFFFTCTTSRKPAKLLKKKKKSAIQYAHET